MRNCRIARYLRPCRNTCTYPGPGCNNCIRTDLDMIGDSDTAAQQNPVADFDAAGNTDLAANQTGFADPDVVADLNLVVDFGSIADSGGFERRAVDRRGGPDLDRKSVV